MPSKRATPSKPRQRTIAARLSEESYEALVAFTDVHGTTIAALLEAIGRRLRSRKRSNAEMSPSG
jgi:hypothetical protein